MPLPLSKNMRAYLLAMMRGEKTRVDYRTHTTLSSRGLVDSHSLLTLEGWKQGVLLLPLPEQCQHLHIEYQQLPILESGQRPELTAWHYYSSKGFFGAYCEGGAVLLLIRAAALEVLSELNTFGSRQDACQRFTEAQLTIHQKHAERIIGAVCSADLIRVLDAFEEIYLSELVREWHPGLTNDAIAQLFQFIGPFRLSKITAAVMEDPYLYRAGWPDLTMTDGSEMMWAEIKTTDKLHLSQITTIHRMKLLLPGTVRVVQLTRG